jgi:hypothetical protein
MRLRLAVAISLVAAGAAQAETVLITAERMLDVRTGRYVQNPQILVRDGRIASVGAAGGRGRPADRPARHDPAAGADRHARAPRFRPDVRRLHGPAVQ